MRPVGRPRLAENGCSNSEGGVRPGLCYHTIGGQPHTKSHIGISTAKASVCRANRRAKALPHHPAHTIKPSVSKGSTGGNVATWGARTASVVWKDISDARGGEAGFLGMATRATGEQSHCQYTMANQQRIQPPSRPRNQCLSAICCESTRQNMPKGGTPGRQSAPCKSGTNCRGGALPRHFSLGTRRRGFHQVCKAWVHMHPRCQDIYLLDFALEVDQKQDNLNNPSRPCICGCRDQCLLAGETSDNPGDRLV